MKTLPTEAPGLSQAEMTSAVVPFLPVELFKGGAKAGWWIKCVQLDREVKGDIIREEFQTFALAPKTGIAVIHTSYLSMGEIICWQLASICYQVIYSR